MIRRAVFQVETRCWKRWEKGAYRVHALKRMGDTVDNMIKAQGILHLPLNSAGYEQGTEAGIELLYPEEYIKAGLPSFE